jgi:hypothetical protein
MTNERLEEILRNCIRKTAQPFPTCCPWTLITYEELESMVNELQACRQFMNFYSNPLVPIKFYTRQPNELDKQKDL